jgi:oxalate decarboxylase/phosphoglucose isomerase-like protein (cupin superfamily)
MKKSTLNPNIFVNKIVDHSKHKTVLLDYFSKQPTKFYKISNSDWLKSEDMDREWVQYFTNNILYQISNNLNDYMNSLELTVQNLWYQQYNFGDYHKWHTHPKCHYTNIYYVELSNKDMITEILNVENIDIKEGDILSFPAFMFHRSKTIKSNQRKTIISFNTSFDVINIDKIKKT